jgi:hypothetical protein
MSANRYSLGITIVAIGLLLFLGKIGFLGFLGRLLWPLFILALGLLAHYFYFQRRLPEAALIPGGMLVIYAAMFLFSTIFGWGAMGYLWPGFLFGIAVGLYEYYYFHEARPQSALLAAIGLAVISAVFFGLTLIFTVGLYLISLLLVIAGLYVLFGKRLALRGRKGRDRRRSLL